MDTSNQCFLGSAKEASFLVQPIQCLISFTKNLLIFPLNILLNQKVVYCVC